MQRGKRNNMIRIKKNYYIVGYRFARLYNNIIEIINDISNPAIKPLVIIDLSSWRRSPPNHLMIITDTDNYWKTISNDFYLCNSISTNNVVDVEISDGDKQWLREVWINDAN